MQKQNPFFKTIPYKKALALGPPRFVREYLFPAMRREHGNGFAMAVWRRDTKKEFILSLDYAYNRQEPACHLVMCIGGTLQTITGARSEKKLSALLGLRYNVQDDGMADDGQLLFYEWKTNLGPWRGLSQAFREALTPAAKEKVAEKAVMVAVRAGEKFRKAEARRPHE